MAGDWETATVPAAPPVSPEWDYKITFLADSFEAFIFGLEPDSAFQRAEE